MYGADQITGPNHDHATDDSLGRYLSEIGRYPLLTRAQEVQLAKRAEAGDGTARRRLVESNLRLVVTIAKSYPTGSLDLLDLIQEGTMGLMKAAERYDWRHDTKFSTYAAWWIRSAIIDALGAAAHPIRLPESVRQRVADVERTERALMARLGRRPTPAEIAVAVDLTSEQVAEARAAAQPVDRLDEPVSADGELLHADLVADPNAADPAQTLVDGMAEEELEARLRTLPLRSRRVLELRFGLGEGVAHTADEVAAVFGVARQRVRQIELQALRRLAAVDPAPALRAA